MGLVRPHFFESTGEKVTGPSLTDTLIARAERELGVRLPQALVDVLSVQNGGYTRFDAYPRGTHLYEYVPFRDVRGIFDSLDVGLLLSAYLLREWEMPEGLVLLSGDGHTWVALDYRACGAQGEPPVVWIDNEAEDSPHIEQVAPDLATFFAGLVDGYHGYVYGFTLENRDELAAGIEARFSVRFVKTEGAPFFVSETMRADHPHWKSHLGRGHAATLWLARNRRFDGGWSYAERQDCVWTLSFDVGRPHRESMEAGVAGLPWPSVALHVPHADPDF